MSLLRGAERCVAAIARTKHLNAFISLPEESALLRQVQDAETNGRGPLNGKLIAIKDNICTSDLPTTAASSILKSFTSPYDATVIKQLRAAGGLIAGKTNMDEFGMGSHSTRSFFGEVAQGTRNNKRVSAGGSSGGSAVAVASNNAWAALGTDTGGSVRLPAAYTGTIGFKPSYGLISRWGVIAYANSLDTVGVFARSSQDAGTVFNALNAHDPKDPTSLPASTRSRISSVVSKASRKRPLRIGVPIEYNIAELNPEVRAVWMQTLRMFANKGHTIHPVSLPTTCHALSAYYVLAPAEASSNLAKYDGVRYGSRAPGSDASSETKSVLFAKSRGEGFGDEVKRRILLGAYTLSAEAIDNYFIQAQKVRRLVQHDFDRVFALPNPLLDEQPANGENNQVDILVCPTAPTLPPTLKSLEGQSPVDAYMNDVFTVPASLAGLPAVSIPVGYVVDGAAATVGIQVIGQYGDDQLVLDFASQYERLKLY
ncbi:A subunit of glutamyl-tRNA amidotransferase [Mytilinidion resinicola]|uniref:Glutamyl-tRNA(Gln) amidotransferase subunit A, mitochondrial n=1 Tax=Mytilinidion resinicola TaxID=574789 RepID=A0A6A6Z1W3_9PEZI|nr:A subunit of glutamyl-tRNA amidotransferase [Mytilinidion resinicola]KAF2814990.1 A subunit of glutamyl-tRNA amidotransferase [Mytilinidion resinicola]